jgi:hypothetical protein
VSSSRQFSLFSLDLLITASRGSSSATLEVLNLEQLSVKEIDLTNPIKVSELEELTQPGGVIAVSAVHSPQTTSEAWSVTAVLDSQGCIRLFETLDSSLDSSKKLWKRVMGVVERESVSGELQGDRGKDGTSKPRFGVDKPKHGKEDEKNEPHVGGNTWAGTNSSI